jgi:8-oxo-dGTP diphosphatase
VARAIAPSRRAEPATTHGDTSVTVDVVLLTIRNGRLSVLLVRRPGNPFAGMWALPGGFVRESEPLEDAARRELKDKTGLDDLPWGMHLEQLRTYGAPERDPRGRVVSICYLGLGPDLSVPAGSPDSRFWAIDDLEGDGGASLAFDHERILEDAVERARAKLEYAPVATAFVDEPFTLADLRRIYEAVWGVTLDAPNFRRKVLSTPGFVTSLGETAPPRGGGRPAELYRRGTATLLHPAMLRPA